MKTLIAAALAVTMLSSAASAEYNGIHDQVPVVNYDGRSQPTLFTFFNRSADDYNGRGGGRGEGRGSKGD